MAPNTLFYIFISILIFDFLLDKFLGYLNATRFNDPIPKKLNEVYNQEEYTKSQNYKTTNYKFGILSSFFSLP